MLVGQFTVYSETITKPVKHQPTTRSKHSPYSIYNTDSGPGKYTKVSYEGMIEAKVCRDYLTPDMDYFYSAEYVYFSRLA